MLELARLVNNDLLGERLGSAYGKAPASLPWTSREREAITWALDDPPAEGARRAAPGSLVAEHAGRVRVQRE